MGSSCPTMSAVTPPSSILPARWACGGATGASTRSLAASGRAGGASAPRPLEARAVVDVVGARREPGVIERQPLGAEALGVVGRRRAAGRDLDEGEARDGRARRARGQIDRHATVGADVT